MALTTERQTDERSGIEVTLDVAASVTIFAGAGIVLSATGYGQPATTATGLLTFGRAEESVDNSAGAAGAKTVRVRRGVFRWANSTAADLIDKQDIEKDCYWVDDQTVALTNGSSTRSKAGKIVDVDSEGVWVDTRR